MEKLKILHLKGETKEPVFNLKYGKQLQWEKLYKNNTIYEKITNCKNKIDELNPSSCWDRGKKINNEYELIHLPNKRVRADSISLYEPLSRSYFKMWELLHEFPIQKLHENEKINVLGIAEGPGGFLEAIHNFRKKYNPNILDNIIGVTLRSDNNDIPGWKKAKRFLETNKNISIDYGIDNTGNIYHIENIRYFHKKWGGKIHIVTADGGFDFSDDFNHQEQKSYHIIFCEIVLAMSCLENGGNFICKIFDIFSKTTATLIQLLCYHFEDVYITKPYTSRPCNSEKYIICKNFKGIDSLFLEKCFIVISLWKQIDNTGSFVNRIFSESYENMDQVIVKNLYMYMKDSIDIQIKNIQKTLKSIEKRNHSNYLVSIQKERALQWCTKYGIEINKNSKFLL